MFVSLRGEPYVLWHAVDRHDIELDILLKKRRDKLAAKRLSKLVLSACAEAPKKIVTDQLGSYRAAKADMPKLANVTHVFVKTAACLNALKRHLLRASLYRKQLAARFDAWRCLPGLTQIRSSLSEGFARMVIMQRGAAT
ncbi:hypothetical protein BGLA2_700131 [Burkholderia gladioli]|nr:hypothetical protein BGLA2_700131 [Burkholderia gladioli]